MPDQSPSGGTAPDFQQLRSGFRIPDPTAFIVPDLNRSAKHSRILAFQEPWHSPLSVHYGLAPRLMLTAE